MDARQFGESDYITAAIVKASPSKKAVVISDAKVEETEFGERLTLQVEIDGKKKTYRPNKDTVRNLIEALGSETKGWLGKTVSFTVNSVMGKDSVIGTAQK